MFIQGFNLFSFCLIWLHWLAGSNFPAQFTVKNVICFSDIFSLQKMVKFFTPFQVSFEFFTSNWKSGENGLGFFHLVSS
jgi:hypothetical protein